MEWIYMVGSSRNNNSSTIQQDWKEFQSENRHMKLPQLVLRTSGDKPSFSSRIKQIIKSSIPSHIGNHSETVAERRKTLNQRRKGIFAQPIPNSNNVRHVEWRQFHKRYGTRDAESYRT